LKKKLISLVLFFVVHSALIAGTPAPKGQDYLNLDFEQKGWKDSVKGWSIGGRSHTITVDTTEKISGNSSLCIEGKTKKNDFGVARTTFPIALVRGKKIKLTGFIKTQELTGGHAALWWRVDGKSKKGGSLAFDNMKDRAPSGTSDWKKYAIELDVPPEGTGIMFGVLMVGSGKAWYDKLEISIDGKLYDQADLKPVVPTAKELAWIKKKAIPFQNANPKAPHKELMGLKKVIGDCHIVALGEATHGSSEFFKMKHRLTRFLAEEMGFTIFAIEANMTEARKVNRYVLYGEGDPKEALSGLYFWTWNTREVLEMIEWMRSYNQSGKGKIQFMGFDMQVPLVAAEAAREFIKKADSQFLPLMDKSYEQVKKSWEQIRKPNGFIKADLPKWHEEAKKVYEHMKARRDFYLKSHDFMEVEWAIQNAHIVMQAPEPYMHGKPSRDESMAKNLDWILAHSPKGTKIITWAHNGHISRNGKHMSSMGSYLSGKHGQDMIVFGFAFDQGTYTAIGKEGLGVYGTSPSEPGSVEWALKKTGIKNMILDLRLTRGGEKEGRWLNQELNSRSIGAMAMDYAFGKNNISEAFDALIYFETSTPSDCLSLRKKEKLEKKEETKEKPHEKK